MILKEYKKLLLFLLFEVINGSCYSQDCIPLGIEANYYIYNKTNSTIIIDTDSNHVEFCKIKHVINKNEKLSSIIENQGILFDGDALTVIYDLNPALDSLEWEDLIELYIPTIKVNFNRTDLLREGIYVSLVYCPDLKKQILDSIQVFRQTVEKIRKIDELSSSQVFGVLIKLVEQTDAFSKIIQSRIRPLNKEFLENFQTELNALLYVTTSIKDAKTCKSEDNKVIETSYATLELMISSVSKYKRNPDAKYDRIPKVCVEVVIVDDTINAEKLRVYYVYRGRINDKLKYYKSFENMPAPAASKYLTIGNYYLWAGKPGNLDPLTELYKLDVTGETAKMRVDLLIHKE